MKYTQRKWEHIPWHKAQKEVKKLQFRIFVARYKNQWRRLRLLQKQLLHSYWNRCLAVRQITVQNRGKNTPGIEIDGVVIKKHHRMALITKLGQLNLKMYKPKPVKRIEIPKKSDKKSKRLLGIPTITDRCIQAMVKTCLEPEWEACFESTSYGFRPGRSAHDAIARVFTVLRTKTNTTKQKPWVLDADIEGFFDNVNHDDILQRLGNFPYKILIERWLKAGIMLDSKYQPTHKGTPQGVSPLLANIALCELEDLLKTAPDKYGKVKQEWVYVRYADDFIVLTRSKRAARHIYHKLEAWLKTKGLKLSSIKTRIVHVDNGFDFLGVTIRKFSTKAKNKQGYVLLTKPSIKAIKALRTKISQLWKDVLGHNIDTVLRRLNPVIRGWRNYYRPWVSADVFQSLDHWMHKKSWRYAHRMHPKKGRKWLYKKYYGKFRQPESQDRWIFGNKKTGQYLEKFDWAKIQRHTLVKGYNSPMDPTLQNYWQQRFKKLFDTSHSKSDTVKAKRQNHICPVCRGSLDGNEALATHHIIQRQEKRIDKYWNLLLMHQHCHNNLHTNVDLEKRVIEEFLPESQRKWLASARSEVQSLTNLRRKKGTT